MEMPQHECISTLIAHLCADIDIFLLCEEDQETTKNEVYTPEQIRKQLVDSATKIKLAYLKAGIDTSEPFKPIVACK